jgi:hypothetical protein
LIKKFPIDRKQKRRLVEFATAFQNSLKNPSVFLGFIVVFPQGLPLPKISPPSRPSKKRFRRPYSGLFFQGGVFHHKSTTNSPAIKLDAIASILILGYPVGFHFYRKRYKLEQGEK